MNLSQAPFNMFAVPRPLDSAQIRNQVWVQVIEQPAPRALRFRYECEARGRSAGSIPGEHSTTEEKTYPAIRIVGYRGKAVVVASCVTRDKPYRAHPHNLVGKGCKKGVCTVEIPRDTMTVIFSNIGIQCVKKKDIEAHLNVREAIRVDPFKNGFEHRYVSTGIDVNSVRLCFQVFLEDEMTKKCTVALKPVVSNPIYDKKTIADLLIVKLSDCTCSVDGGRKDIVLVCDKITKEDIQVCFFEEMNGAVVWEGLADIHPSQVFKQHVIWFLPPRYHTLDITEPVKVNIQLRRPSDGATSEALPFEYLPLDSGVKRKRRLETSTETPLHDIGNRPDPKKAFKTLNNMHPLKIEPKDTVLYATPSYTSNPVDIWSIRSTSGINTNNNNFNNDLCFISNESCIRPGSKEPFNALNIPPVNIRTEPQVGTRSSEVPSMDMWNTPSTSGVNNNRNNEFAGASNAMSIELLNVDNQNSEFRQVHINSDDLSMLSDNLSNNLSLTDIPNKELNSDSLTHLVNKTYNKLCNDR